MRVNAFYSDPRIAEITGSLGTAIFGDQSSSGQVDAERARYFRAQSDRERLGLKSEAQLGTLFNTAAPAYDPTLTPHERARRALSLQAAAGNTPSEVLARGAFLGENVTEDDLARMDATFGGANQSSVYSLSDRNAHPLSRQQLTAAAENVAQTGLADARTATENALRDPKVASVFALTNQRNTAAGANQARQQLLERKELTGGTTPPIVTNQALNAMDAAIAEQESIIGEDFDENTRSLILRAASEEYQSTRNPIVAVQNAITRAFGPAGPQIDSGFFNDTMIVPNDIGTKLFGTPDTVVGAGAPDLSELEGQTVEQDGVFYVIRDGVAIPQS